MDETTRIEIPVTQPLPPMPSSWGVFDGSVISFLLVASGALGTRLVLPAFRSYQAAVQQDQKDSSDNQQFFRQLLQDTRHEHEKFITALGTITETLRANHNQILDRLDRLEKINGEIPIARPAGLETRPEARAPHHARGGPDRVRWGDEPGPVYQRGQ